MLGLNKTMLGLKTHMLGLKTHMLGLNTHMLGVNTHMVVQCRHDVQPDGQLYSSLMDVAGQAKRVDLAFDLQADMVAQGLQPSQVIIVIMIIMIITIIITTIIMIIIKACKGEISSRMLLPTMSCSAAAIWCMHICCCQWCVMRAHMLPSMVS